MARQSAERFLRDFVERIVKKALKEFPKIAEILRALSTIFDEITEIKKTIKVLSDNLQILAKRVNVNDVRIDKIEKFGATPDTKSQNGIPHITGKDIFEFRKTNNISLKNLAALLGIKADLVSKWERSLASIHPNAEKELRKYINMPQDKLLKAFQDKDIFYPFGNAPKKRTPLEKKRPKIITPSQIRALRLTLGLTQKGIASKYKVNISTWCNWEYGRTAPPVDIAKTLLEKHKELFGDVINVHAGTTDTSADSLSLEKLDERIKTVGLSRKELAKMMGVCRSTIDNWVNQKTTPSDENIEKLIGILGAGQTQSTKDAVQKREESKQKRKKPSSDYQHSAQELRNFRKDNGLSQREMSILMRVPLHRYVSWERKNRGLPPEYNSSFKSLLLTKHDEIIRQLNYWAKRSKQ